jgi:hypothetical protein
MKSDLFGNLMVKLLVLSLGLFLFLSFAYKFYSYAIFRYHSVAVYGKVEKAMWGGDIGGRPFIDYKDTLGKIHSFRSKAKTNWFFAPKKGDKVKVFFLKNDPQQAIVDSVFYYILLPLVFCVLGAAILFTFLKSSWRDFKEYQRKVQKSSIHL